MIAAGLSIHISPTQWVRSRRRPSASVPSPSAQSGPLSPPLTKETMPRPRPPHLVRQITRHGTPVWYVRLGHGPRVRLRAEFGTPEFEAEYQAALTGAPRTQKGASLEREPRVVDRPLSRNQRMGRAFERNPSPAREHLSARLGERWRQAIQHRSPPQRSRLGASAGPTHLPRRATSSTPCAGCFDGRSRRSTSKPTRLLASRTRRARRATGSLPGPRKTLRPTNGDGRIGTRQRVWLDVLLYTGLRRGDAVRFGRQHVRDGVGQIKTEKSGFTITVTLPILPVLAATLKAGPCGDLTLHRGRERQAADQGVASAICFKDACKAAGVPGSAHGVRKIAATRAANHGATVAAARSHLRVDRRHDGRRSTRGRRIASGSRSRLCTSSRTMSEHLFPHPCKR